MALIKCPECGNTISDKAEKCPHCGCPLTPVAPEVSATPKESSPPVYTNVDTAVASVTKSTTSKKGSKKKLILPAILIILVLALWGVLSKFLPPSVHVDDINIAKWKLTDQGSYIDTYTATITSDTRKPFVAVIGSYESEYNYLDDGTPIAPLPDFVYMENGEGSFECIVLSDDDPSLKRVPVGYLPCQKLSEKDIKSISFSVGDYSDYNDATSCSFDFDIELKDKSTGILIFDIANDMNKTIDYGQQIAIIDGKGSGSIYLSDLPMKSRGVKPSLQPRAFCVATRINDSHYTLDKDFSVETSDTTYSTRYDGEMRLHFDDTCKEGCLLYTIELTEGGKTADRGKVNTKLSSISNHIADITTYDSCTKGEKYISPQYDVNLVAYVPYKELP